VDDRVAAGDGGVQRLRPRQVSLGELAPQRLEPLRLRAISDEAADISTFGAQRLDDMAADEAAGSRDEDHWKFL
jgi:hypothetical protein